VENLLSRYRNVTILVAVLFAEIIGLAIQVKRATDTESTRLIRVWIVETVTPLEKGFEHAQDGIHNLWRNYFYLRGVRAENRALHDHIEQLRLEQVRLNEDAQQAHRLQTLLGFKEQFISKTMAAQVIGASGSDISRVLYIDKGANDGLKQDMAVITSEGIVGKILRVFPSSSQVLLINDPSSGVGAILEKSRLQGVLKGTAGGEIVLEKVMADEQVQVGERVLTSGGDQIFPKGLAIGTVRRVAAEPDLFLNIRVKPATDLGRIEEVLVITKVDEKEPPLNDASGPIRAIDILAARLPSVPDKPADANAKPTGAGPAAAGASAANAANTNTAAAANSKDKVGAASASQVPSKNAAVAAGNQRATTEKSAAQAKDVEPSTAKKGSNDAESGTAAAGQRNAPVSETNRGNSAGIPKGPRTHTPHPVNNPVAETGQPAGDVPH